MRTGGSRAPASEVIALPPPVTAPAGALGDLLARRRSARRFGAGPLSISSVGQLLWTAQGTTGRDGHRVAPSAGALYPLEISVVAGRVDGLAPAYYRYQAHGHSISSMMPGDLRAQLAAASWGQDFMAQASVIFVISAVSQRTTRKYGERGHRYVHMEAGHAAQNLCLMATALGLSIVVVGAFDDEQVRAALRFGADESPLALLPVGPPQESG